jgi:lipopolysaccharide transport system ATP-binding protein
MNDFAIIVGNLTKIYKLYPNHKARFKEALHPKRRKYHRDFCALKNVSLRVKRGEVLGIVGKNGSGKSTLLKIISGVLQATRGNVVVNGKISALLELGSGFNLEFTGLENIYFYGSIMGFTKDEMETKQEDILSFADIGDFVKQPLKQYSSGMIARLSFAVAINIDPEILIVDEVLAVGDELFRRKCYAKIEKFMEEGKTILFVTHSVGTINELCTRAILLDGGELILEGPSKLVTTQYERFLYAKPEKIVKIRSKLIQLNQDEDQKKRVQNGDGLLRDERKINEDKIKRKTIKKGEKQPHVIRDKPFYIPDFQPQSTVEYRNCDVDIYEIEIRTLDNHKVNALVMKDKYIYSYKVRFNIAAKNVSFGMKLKTEKGLFITGASSYKFAKQKRQVTKGEIYQIDWEFQCLLLPGTYYANVGVSSLEDEKRVFLNRIVDAMAFRVQKTENVPYSGIICLEQNVNITKLNE